MLPRQSTAAGVQGKPNDTTLRHLAENSLCSAIEDGALIAGGLLATIAVVLGVDFYVVVSLFVAAMGKGIPSIAREFRDYGVQPKSTLAPTPKPPGPQTPTDPALQGNRATRAADALADMLLVSFAALGGLAYFPIQSLAWALLLIGLGFFAKAIVDIVEDGYISVNSDSKHPELGAFEGSARGTENMLFLVFGLVAIVVVLWAATSSTEVASLSLGLAALGKGMPSLAPTKSSAGSAQPSYDLYEVI
jgi:hypothetical protein